MRNVTAHGQAGPGRAQGRGEGRRELPRQGGARGVRPGGGDGRAARGRCEWGRVSRVGQAAGGVRPQIGPPERTLRGSRRAGLEAWRSPPHSTRRARFRLGREGPVLECEAIPAPAALHRVARLRVLWQGDDPVAIGAAYPVGDRGDPAVPFGPHPEGKAGSVRAVDHVAGTRAGRHGNLLAAVRALHGGSHRPKRRLSFPRSNPMITSSPTTITGTASRPFFAVSSARAASSSVTFFAVNTTP